MTEDANTPISPDPLAKAVANGFVEPEAPSHEDRVTTLIADVEHAMKSNAPISPAMFHELKALLG